LRELIDRDLPHRSLYMVFLQVRDAAAKILDSTSLADLVNGMDSRPGATKKRLRKKKEASLLPMVVHGNRGSSEN
jgi:DNA-binding IscR family transcriptional regulator